MIIEKIQKIIRKNRLDLILTLLILFLSPLFFYKLGQSSLVSWDEAWYGGIAKNIVATGNFWNLSFNGNDYFDHPPAGFWFIALSLKILGESDFAVRLAPAILGFTTLFITYFLGKELFNRIVGFSSALALSSAIWFLYRARSGNLDSILTFFFMLSLLLAVKASKDKKYLWPLSVSLVLLFLTKTIVPFVIIPSLLIIFWGSKYHLKDFLKPTLLLVASVGSWFLMQYLIHPGFLNHYFKIGLPGVKTETNYLENLKQIKEYLHSSIGKWFWPGIGSAMLSPLLLQKRFLILSSFFFSFFVPFILSEKGQIWHLVPLAPIMILSFFGFLYAILEFITLRTKREDSSRTMISILILGICFYFSFNQLKMIRYQFIDIPAFISDEAILSKEAGKYSEKFYIDADFVPAAVYYSGKVVQQIGTDELIALFDGDTKFVMITYQYRLDSVNVPKAKYQLLKTDRDKILVLKI